MLATNIDPITVRNYIVVILILMFLFGIFQRFLNTVTDKTAQTHAAGGFLAGLYLGYDLDPDSMIFREFVNLTVILGEEFTTGVLSVLTILSYMEIFLGWMYVMEKRGKIGLLGGFLLIVAGYSFAHRSEIAILCFIIGVLTFAYAEDSEFGHR